MFASVVRHFVIEFNGFYYDINGKHTKAELEEYCAKEFSWRGVNYKTMSTTELATWMHNFQYWAGEVIDYYSSKIKVQEKTETSTTDDTDSSGVTT